MKPFTEDDFPALNTPMERDYVVDKANEKIKKLLDVLSDFINSDHKNYDAYSTFDDLVKEYKRLIK